jgi:CelD/BcsL family acetyltransferase involved in cellulose biosynthesis
LRIALHREIPEDPKLLRQWNTLAANMKPPEVFYTCEWALAVQAAYRASVRPLLVLGYDGSELVGVASLATDSEETKVGFLAANTADYCDFLSAPASRREFVKAVFSEISSLTGRVINLANLPADSETLNALRDKSCLRRFHTFIRPAYVCAQVGLGTGEQRHELSSSLLRKKKLRRYLREMEREGSVTFAHLQSWEEIEKALPGFAQAHVERFRATGRLSSLPEPQRRRFLEELAKHFDGAGVVTLSVLKIQDRPVAWNYGFRFHGSWFWYQPTFDSRHEQNSPGYCLLARIVIDACDQEGIERVDLGLGAEGYKERFGNRVRPTLHATVSHSRLRHWREVIRYKAGKLVKRSPKAESLLRRILR